MTKSPQTIKSHAERFGLYSMALRTISFMPTFSDGAFAAFFAVSPYNPHQEGGQELRQ